MDSNLSGYIINHGSNIKSQLLKICTFDDEYIINSYRINKNIILLEKFAKNNLYSFLSELCKKSKYNVLEVLFKEIDLDIKEKKIANSLKDLLSTCFALLNNAVWLSKTDIEFFENCKKDINNNWFNLKIDAIIKTIVIIINNHNSQLIFNKTIIIYDEKNNKQEKIIKESFLDALLDSQNGFNKDNNYLYSNIIYDKITRNFKEIFNSISENKIDNLLTEIDNKVSDSTMLLKNNKIKDINFLEERNKYFNDWACFLMTQYTHKYVEKILKTIIISKSNEDDTVDIYIKKLLLKPCNTTEFKRYFKFFFDSPEKIHSYYTNIVKYIIFDIYEIYIEALNLYDDEYNKSTELEKNGLSVNDIETEIMTLKNNNKNMFYDAFKYDKNYQNDPFIKEEINQKTLYSDKIKCVYKNLIKKMSIQFFKIFGFFYKNDFLKEDIIKIIMKNNFKYTSIKFMKEFIKYSNVKSNDSCNYHKNMMILFKKKYESILLTCNSITKYGYDELFKIYNNINTLNNKINNSNLSISPINLCFIPISTTSRKPSFDILEHINELRIGTETPIFNKELTLFSPLSSPALSSLFDLDSTCAQMLLESGDQLLVDHDLLKLMDNFIPTDNHILDYISNNKLSSEIIITTFLHSLENIKLDNLLCTKKLLIKLNTLIKIDKDIINNIFEKYSELKKELILDDPLFEEKINIIFSGFSI